MDINKSNKGCQLQYCLQRFEIFEKCTFDQSSISHFTYLLCGAVVVHGSVQPSSQVGSGRASGVTNPSGEFACYYTREQPKEKNTAHLDMIMYEQISLNR